MSFVSGVIRRLKLRKRQHVDLYYVDTQNVDLKTGKVTTTKTKIKISKAVVMPPSFSLDPSKVLRGGWSEVGNTVILIDGRDIPKNIDVRDINKLYVVIQGQRYEVKDSEEYPIREAFVFRLKGLHGIAPEQIHIRFSEDGINFFEFVEITLNA